MELPGFSTLKRENITVQVGQRLVLNFGMTVSSLQKSVTVAAASPLVDLAQSKVSGNIDQRQIQDLPLDGRNWLELTLLAPGSRVNTVTNSPFGNTGAFQLNVDGQQVTNQLACTTWGQAKFSYDAIQEFEMVTSRFDASQGRSTGVQVNAVTKAGTNQLSGTAAGYFRNDKFNSPDFISKKVLPYSDQQGSVTIGGPIIKDKLHFYWDGERNPRSFTFTSIYPSFNNIPGFNGSTTTDNKWGGRGDYQFTLTFLPFRTAQPHELHDVSPRLGFALAATPKTVIRGGWGMYYQGMSDQPSQHSLLDPNTVSMTIFNDGRPDFPSNPFNGPLPTFEQALALAGTRSTAGLLLSPTARTPLTYQYSVGIQQQLGNDMSFKADYVATDDRYIVTNRNINLTYNPATGANYPFTSVANRAYPNWSTTTMKFMDAASNYKGLETALTKRMSHHWQASVSYTLQYVWALDNLPLNSGCQYPMTAPGVCNVPIALAPDLPQGTWYLTGAQRHRATFNGLWQGPLGLQLSGIFFYGDNGRSTTTPGVDVRQAGTTAGRLLPDGTLIPRNDFKNDATKRVDARLTRHFKFTSRVGTDLMLEGFNLFNSATYSYTLNRASRAFGLVAAANQPRIVQLGFRITY